MFQAPLVLPLLKAAATRISPHEVHHVTQKNSEEREYASEPAWIEPETQKIKKILKSKGYTNIPGPTIPNQIGLE